MNETLNHIDWDAVAGFRVAGIVLQVILLMEIVMMLSHYWWRMVPIRREFGEALLAPPVYWTFSYHFFVAVYIGVQAVSQWQRLVVNGHPTISTWATAPLALAGLVIIKKFSDHYSAKLSDEEHRRFHQK